LARRILLFLACLALAAHHLRAGEPGLLLFWLTLPLVLRLRRPVVPLLVAGAMAAGAAEWLLTAASIADLRAAAGKPALRMWFILGGVAGVTALAGVLHLRAPVRKEYGLGERPFAMSLSAFLLTATLLTIVQLKVEPSMILLERFLTGGGWLQAFWFSIYAAWLADAITNRKTARKLRPRVWLLFSLVFYGQLTIGLLGMEQFLMSGKLHLPVPAIIAAGPVFRGGGWFMATLFAASLLVVGPAWCSWLCYLGGVDNWAALKKKRPGAMPTWRRHARLAILGIVLAVAASLRLLGVPGAIAAGLGGAFGLAGVGVMLFWSRRSGVLAHCTLFCPIGWMSTRLGKVSPFRLRVGSTCSRCLACTYACRFDAMKLEDLERGRPGPSCTLCGDCLAACTVNDDIHYTFPGLGPERARALFLVLVASLHATFMGLAMI